MDIYVGQHWRAVSNNFGGEATHHTLRVIHGVDMEPYGYQGLFWIVAVEEDDGRPMPGAAAFWIDDRGQSVGQVAGRLWMLTKPV